MGYTWDIVDPMPFAPSGGSSPQPPPVQAHNSQEQMILAQSKANVMILEPRVAITKECLQILEDAAHTGTVLLDHEHGTDYLRATFTMVSAMMKAQLIQLRAALVEGQRDLDRSKQVIQQIESPVKIFRPAGNFPQGAA